MKNIKKTIVTLVALAGILSSCTSQGHDDLFGSPEEVSSKYRTYYQILVYSYADSNGDGIGDFKGIADKLPYLDELGIGGLWLSPVNESSAYHSYDVTNYYGIKSLYEVDGYTFDNLIADAAEYDIDIIMDLVINHSGRNNMWFVSGLGAFKNGTESKYKTWYNFSDTQSAQYSSGSNGAYYEAIFWEGMPDFNYDNPEVRAEMIKIAKHWLAKGVAGFRLDAAMHIFTDYSVSDKWNGDIYDKNIAWWQEFQGALEEEYPDVYLIGEMWTNIEKIKRYYASNLDSAFNFDTRDKIMSAISGGDGFAAFLDDFQEGVREYQSDGIEAYFVSNHDDDRLASFVTNGDRLKMAASLQLLAPGNGFVYYGDEIGMRGSGGSGDGVYRTPMMWGDDYDTNPSNYGIGGQYSSSTASYDDVLEQIADEESLLNYYQQVISIKNTYRELYAGTLREIDSDNNKIQAYTVTLGETTTLVIHNTGSEQLTINLTNVDELLTSISVSGSETTLQDGTATLPGQSTTLVRLSKSTTSIS